MNMNANIPWTMFPCSQGDVPDTPRMLQALYNAVISSSVDDEEDEEALKLLSELLAEEGVDPNAGDEALWSNVSPLVCVIGHWAHLSLNLELTVLVLRLCGIDLFARQH